ncbi:L-rhamnose mutarotase [Fodinibius salsisoli]|uniref:L-rhamnose mutarotase n=1 Tax=Fodinibius salsisoli TaxID=2820877 RepID=A0ABT3PPX8_9BACT|nr:L-rhamnose mutarotase [Fodinibius salsisoli]MCW9707920.1 L-rhamnose mutarotase [Fodinibius salsisoli]
MEKEYQGNYKRYCKTLTLKDDAELIREYKKIHKAENMWTEITQGMKEVGILDMQIYIYENVLFMIMDTVPDFDHDVAMQKLSQKPRQAEWEAYVSKFQQADEDSFADQKWKPMERIFKLAEE